MKNLLRAFGSSALAALLVASASADTIYMKNGSVIRGSVVGYADGEFTVMLNAGPSGARSRATLAGDEIDHIEFEGDSAGAANAGGPGPEPADAGSDPGYASSDPGDSEPPPVTTRRADPGPAPAPASDTGRTAGGGMAAGQSDVRVDPKADWTNTGFKVTRGTRVRITADGSIKLDPQGRRSANPGGVDIPDRDKLMPNRPTGALIAVIGDDNDDFIFVGSQVEFVADRTGYLFLSVNEGFLRDNSGAFTAHVAVDPSSGSSVARTGGGLNGGRPTAAPVPARRSAPPDDASPRPVPASTTRREEPAEPPSSAPASAAATVSREDDVVVQSNLDWTNTKVRVQRGNIVRISATGTVALDRSGLRAGPAGVEAPDADKLIQNRPTGALIAVIGDDNDDFVFVGPETEFIAQHDGVLFLSINEGNLKDNAGTFAAHVTILQSQIAAPTGSASPRPAPRNAGGGSLPKPVVDDTLGGGAQTQAPAPKAPKPAPAIGANGGQADLVVSAKSDWTSTAIVVKKGMKIRITATGTAKLDAGGKASATPAGTTAPDAHKVMKDKPTGALIAVVGDDNTDYIFVGASVEFTAQRDGLLFLGINEGDLFDNSGSYTVHIVVTPAGRR
jgi:hypothetical protein